MFNILLLSLMLLISCGRTENQRSSMESLNYISKKEISASQKLSDSKDKEVFLDYASKQEIEPLCIKSCTSRPLRIAITPISYSYPEVIKEIQNTLSLIYKSGKVVHNINIIENDDFENKLSMFKPDIIVGPFNEVDMPILKKHLKNMNLEIPVISLATRNFNTNIKNNPVKNTVSIFDETKNSPVYNMGYRVEDEITVLMEFLKSKDYHQYIMLAPNNDLGANTYDLFKKYAKKNGNQISQVEFYEENDESIAKHLERLSHAIKQTYYKNVKTGKAQEDIYSFTKDIVATEGDVVIMKNGSKFYKRYQYVEGIIIDASSKNLKAILDFIYKDPLYRNITIILSPRTVNGIIDILQNDASTASQIGEFIVMPTQFATYRPYYELYKNEFNLSPTRLSTTLYESIKYIFEIHEADDIQNHHFNVGKIPVFDGINGIMVADYKNKSFVRYPSIIILKNGVVKEINSYEYFKKNNIIK